MLATVAAADSASTVRKKYSVFMYSEVEPRAMYAIYKQTRKLCVLQYIHTYIHSYMHTYTHICLQKLCDSSESTDDYQTFDTNIIT